MDAVDIWRWLDCDRWPIVLKMEIFRYSDVDIPNLTMDDPSGESWGDLDLFMSCHGIGRFGDLDTRGRYGAFSVAIVGCR